MKKCYDKHLRHTNFNIGDAVWYYNPQRKVGICPKLQRPWKGPFTVTKKLNDVLYRIQFNQRSKAKIVHHDRLKIYNSRHKPTWFNMTEVKTSLKNFLWGQTDVEINYKVSKVRRLLPVTLDF